MTTELIFRTLKLADLKFAEYNPRIKLTPDDPEYGKIKTSLEKFGLVVPLVVNADMTVVGGNQRLQVMRDLGWTETSCVMVNLDKSNEKALNIALNKISGDWDAQQLNELLRNLAADTDFDLEITGFDQHEIDLALASFDGLTNPEPTPHETVTEAFSMRNSTDPEEALINGYTEPQQPMRRCPHCGHVDIDRHFVRVNNDTSEDPDEQQ